LLLIRVPNYDLSISPDSTRTTIPLDVKRFDRIVAFITTAPIARIGLICKELGANAHQVMDIFCKDTDLNISPRYLKPGFAFGGSCLPKDVRALTSYANKADVPAPLLNSVLASNNRYLEHCIGTVLATGRKRIGLLGLSFKTGTDDLRESPMVTLAETLIGKGLEIQVFDTDVSVAQLTGRNREYIDHHIPHIARLLKPTIEEVMSGSDVLVIGNPSSEFKIIEKLIRPNQMLIDFGCIIDFSESRSS
jgi:GDP-mannose 6-dehydrogenase